MSAPTFAGACGNCARQAGVLGRRGATAFRRITVSPDRLTASPMNKGDAMVWIRIVLAAALIVQPVAASAAELPLPRPHKVHAAKVHHARVAYVARVHFGYYWGRWGSRSGGTESAWYGSTFVLAGGPWEGAGVVLAASPKGVARIHCADRSPDACLAEPLLAPVAVAAPTLGR
jgi:hypothetical protein